MLDIKFVRNNPDVVKQNIKNKFQDEKLPLVDEVIELDKRNREIKQEVEAILSLIHILIQLGVTSDRLEYEVIEKGSAGFLGIGMKQAVIEARRKPEPKEEKVEEPVVEEPVKAEPKKVETVQPQKAAAEKKADEPQKAAFEKAVEKEVKEEVKKETKLVEVQPQTDVYKRQVQDIHIPL